MSSVDRLIFSGPGSRVALARDIAKMSQAELGEKVGKRKITIGRWEKGTTPIPVLAWEVLSEVLGVRVEWLKDGQEPMVQSPAMRANGALEPAGQGQARTDSDSRDPRNFRSWETRSGPAQISASRRLALMVLKEELGGLWNKIPEMTDDQVAELSAALRKAMGKNDVISMTSLDPFQD